MLQLQTKKLTVDQCRMYFQAQGYNYSDQVYEQLLEATNGDFPLMAREIQIHTENLEAFLQNLKKLSKRRQLSAFHANE